MERFFDPNKIILTGNPVRKDIEFILKEEGGNKYFNIKNSEKVILVLGGSLGAKSINEGIMKSADYLSNKMLN